MASRRRSAFSLRLRNLRTPAASSMIARRSSGRALSTASIWPWLTITCCWRPTPASDSSSCTSSRRHGTPLIEYSESPLRNRMRVTVISLRSTPSVPSELSIVMLTSARPSAGRFAVPAKITSSIFWLRTDFGACAPSTQAMRVDDVRLARAVRPDDDRDPGLQDHRRAVGEGLEALEVETLQEHSSGRTYSRDRPLPRNRRRCRLADRRQCWQTGQKWVPRPAVVVRRIQPRPHVRHRSPPRPYTRWSSWYDPPDAHQVDVLRVAERRTTCGDRRSVSTLDDRRRAAGRSPGRRATTPADRAGAGRRGGSRRRRCCRCRRSRAGRAAAA